MRIFRAISAVVLALFVVGVAHSNTSPAIKFIENKNQWAPDVHFRADVTGGHFSLVDYGFRFHFYDYQKLNALHHQRTSAITEAGTSVPGDDRVALRAIDLTFLKSNKVRPGVSGKSGEYYNFFKGNDPARWGTGAHAFSEVTYSNFYNGIDMRVYSQGPNVKYDWIVQPHAEVSQIQWSYAGLDSLSLRSGKIYATTPLAEVIEQSPIAWQLISGVKVNVRVAYRLTDGVAGFYFPDGYDTCEPLTIDPLLIFSTYSGATADNWGSTATPGEHGNLYSAGVVRDVYSMGNNQIASGQLSETDDSFQPEHGNAVTDDYDIAIFKYDSTGATLIYASYLGGVGNESPHSLIMNHNEELIVLGTSSSQNFPTTAGAVSEDFVGGNFVNTTTISYGLGSDLVLARISADGRSLLSSTYLGGEGNDGLNVFGGPLVKNYGDDLRGDLAVDAQDNVYLASVTRSEDFPVANSFGGTFLGGNSDGIVAKLNKEFTQVLWAAYIGSAGTDCAHTIKLDADGNLVVAGGTAGIGFPTTPGAFQVVKPGAADGWVARIKTDGSEIMQASFMGTSGFDQVYFVDLDSDGNVYLFGQTDGNFPVTAGVYNNPNSGQFLVKLSADLSTRIYSTVFGSGEGIPNISPTAFLVNDCNNIYMAGWGGVINNRNPANGFWVSDTFDMPITPDALQPVTRGSDFYFIVLTADASQLLYATYLGGTQASIHVDGGTSRFDKSGVVYHAVCAGCGAGYDDFPTSPTAWSRLNRSQNCNNAAFKFDLSSLTARFQTNNELLTMPNLTNVCIPDGIVLSNLSTGGETYEWDMGDGSAVIIRSDATPFTYHYQQAGLYTITLTAIDPGTCKVRDEATRTMRVSESVSIVQEDDSICEGESYQLQASGGLVYQWQTGSGTLSVQNPIVTPVRTTRYYVNITEASGCMSRDTVTIEVIPSIFPEFRLDRMSGCEGRPTIQLDNAVADSTDYEFTFRLSDGTETDLRELQHTFDKDSLYSVTLVAQREFCVWDHTQSVDIRSVRLPNAITPRDKDGRNDVFIIEYGRTGQTPADYDLKVNLLIYNRWGTVVFETDDYQYNWSGEDLLGGVYFYEATIEGYATCKDWLHLVK